MSKCPQAAVPPPLIPRDPKEPRPPGPHDPPGPKPSGRHEVHQDCCPDNLTPSVMYPGMLTFKPVETCRHGFHGLVAA